MKRNVIRAIFVLCCLASPLLANGASSQTKIAQPAPMSDTTVADVLGYFARINALSFEALHVEHAQQEQLLAAQSSVQNRLQVAVLLSIPGTSFQDNSRALALLQECLGATPDENVVLKNFVLFVSAVVAERDKQAKAYEQLTWKLHSMALEKARQDATQEKLSHDLHKARVEKEAQERLSRRMSKRLYDEQKTVKNLQKKIEEIKGIEKSIIERNVKERGS
jgi:hypothetical protein